MAIPGNIRVKADGKHEIALMGKLRHLLSPKGAWTSLPQVAPCPPAPFHRRWPPQRFACAYRCNGQAASKKNKRDSDSFCRNPFNPLGTEHTGTLHVTDKPEFGASLSQSFTMRSSKYPQILQHSLRPKGNSSSASCRAHAPLGPLTKLSILGAALARQQPRHSSWWVL